MSSSATGKQKKSKVSKAVQEPKKTKPLTNQNQPITETIDLVDIQQIDDQINKISSMQPSEYGIKQKDSILQIIKNNISSLRKAQFYTDCILPNFENNYNSLQNKITNATLKPLFGANNVKIGHSSSYITTVHKHIGYVTEAINQIDTKSPDNLYLQYALAYLLTLNFFLRRFQDVNFGDLDLFQHNIKNQITEVNNSLHKEITEVKDSLNNRIDEVDSKIDRVKDSLHKEITEVKDSLHKEITEVKDSINTLSKDIKNMISSFNKTDIISKKAFNFYKVSMSSYQSTVQQCEKFDKELPEEQKDNSFQISSDDTQPLKTNTGKKSKDNTTSPSKKKTHTFSNSNQNKTTK